MLKVNLIVDLLPTFFYSNHFSYQCTPFFLSKDFYFEHSIFGDLCEPNVKSPEKDSFLLLPPQFSLELENHPREQRCQCHVLIPNSRAIYTWFPLFLMRGNSFPIWAAILCGSSYSAMTARHHPSWKQEASCQGNCRGLARLYWHWNLGWSLASPLTLGKNLHGPLGTAGVLSKRTVFSAWFLICDMNNTTCWSGHSKSLDSWMINYNLMAFKTNKQTTKMLFSMNTT